MTKTNILIWGALFLAAMWYILIFIPKIDEKRMKLYEPVSNIEITAEEINLDGYLSNEQVAIEVATETVRIEKKPVVVKTSPVVKEKPVTLTTEESKLKEEPVVEEKPVVNLNEISDWHFKTYINDKNYYQKSVRLEFTPITNAGTLAKVTRCVYHSDLQTDEGGTHTVPYGGDGYVQFDAIVYKNITTNVYCVAFYIENGNVIEVKSPVITIK